MPRRITEIVFVDWNPNFYAALSGKVIEFSAFTSKKLESSYESDLAEKLEKKLERYFSGKRVSFDEFKVSYPSEFSKRVLEEVRKIEYGKVCSYSDLAEKLGTSPRAVGVALKMNRVPVIVPCHRVVAKNGLGGYSHGVNLKLKLLKLEGVECACLSGRGSL
ncbi:methylated-DNA/protein-cysteine methyltransferase [Ferroglobus placidus DSM 10642]|uniref:methylated-DNA--[protein]-cysteine S-methyltransferase n=1 Tax=Ferroglobus placidus (strain DSM 10642 / AEDII12DO) TaxID=589924 RepID=D3S091_FERPA|nr:methylated-DNA/protein-cysteine methyltransferase [Ferroglobus placidus DSM 10642]